MSKNSLSAMQIALCVSLALAARAGSAQNAAAEPAAPPAASSNELGDIIVTARRVEERVDRADRQTGGEN